jgi:hypothetical protein
MRDQSHDRRRSDLAIYHAWIMDLDRHWKRRRREKLQGYEGVGRVPVSDRAGESKNFPRMRPRKRCEQIHRAHAHSGPVLAH